MYVIIHSSKARVNINVSYGLWVIMMCQCRFISCNKSVLWWEMLIGDDMHVQGQRV